MEIPLIVVIIIIILQSTFSFFIMTHRDKTLLKNLYTKKEVIELLTKRVKHFGTKRQAFNALLLKQDLDWFEKHKK